MKTNISLLMGLCVLIFANSAIAMNPKPYQELKEEFIKANNGQNPTNTLAKAAVLQKCFTDPYYQWKQVWVEKNEILKNSTWLSYKIFQSSAIPVALGIVSVGLSFKKNINPAITKGLDRAFTISTSGIYACIIADLVYSQKEKYINPLNSFDNEKEWLINELKSLKGLPSEHTTKLNKELEKSFQEKLAQKHS